MRGGIESGIDESHVVCTTESFHEQRCTCQAGPYPAGLVLHSWMGSAEMTKQLARTEGVYFSISGHTLGMSDRKLGPILQQASHAALKASAPDQFHIDH